MLATFNSFIFNRLWTFRETLPFAWVELFKFYATIGSGLLINLGVHFINVQLLHVNDLISALISALCTAVWGFLVLKTFVFK